MYRATVSLMLLALVATGCPDGWPPVPGHNGENTDEAVPVDTGEAAVLTFADVTLNTLDDNKEGDSRIALEVRDLSGRAVARDEGSFGTFDDRTTRAVELIIVDPGATWADVSGGLGCVRWLAIGSNDQWNASFDYTLRFSDGRVLLGAQETVQFQEGRTIESCATLR